MKKNIIITVIVIVVLGVLADGYYYYSQAQEQQKLADQKAKEEQIAEQEKQQADAEAAKLLKCFDTDNYSIVTRDHKDSVGQDVLVKAKGANGTQCVYNPDPSDFDLTNNDPQYYKAQVQNALVTDIGTGPSGRKFRLYDLKDKSLITEKDYYGDLTVASDTLTYFGLSKTKADKKNCKNYADLMKNFNNANLVVKKIVNLQTFLVKETKETNCVANQ